MTDRPLHICFDRIVPDDDKPDSVAAAVTHYRETAARHGVTAKDLPDLSADHPVIVARMAIIAKKQWPNGKALTCCFLDGEPAWQAKVIKKAKIWEKYANIKLQFVDGGDATIRISFFADSGSWSAVGQDCLRDDYFPPGGPTMNYGWLRDDTPDHEYGRVVVHEFGHALGCIHEHQSPDEHLKWKKAAVYAAFGGPPNNWSPAEVDHNILQKYGQAGVVNTVFDRKSIMLYQFDGALFEDGIGTPENEHLSKLDKAMIAKMYPPL